MIIQTRCATCEQVFEPTSESITKGTWRQCPSCRIAQATQDAAVIARRLEVDRQQPGPEAA